MNIPTNLLYTESHEWVEIIDDKTVKTGLTEFATAQLGELVFVNLPEVDDAVVAGENFADVESVKAVSDFYSPATGEIIAINEEILDNPASINADPYEAWFAKIGNVSDKRKLMNAEEYETFVQQQEV